MGLISARFRRSKESSQEPEQMPEPIKRYRVHSLPARTAAQPEHSHPQYQHQDPQRKQYYHVPPQLARRLSTSVRCSHRDDFSLVTSAWKRDSQHKYADPIKILEPSDASIQSSGLSMWSDPSIETQLSFKRAPAHTACDLPVGAVSPTFSLCASPHDLSPSPSLDYSGSVSSNSSGWSAASAGSRSSGHSRQSSNTAIDAKIPPLLPPHRTFSGNPHHGSFYKKPQRHARNTSVASDYIPLHVFTRDCKAPVMVRQQLQPPKQRVDEKRFSLDGYNGGLKVVNGTPPGSPPGSPLFSSDMSPESAPTRYRVPSKASLMCE